MIKIITQHVNNLIKNCNEKLHVRWTVFELKALGSLIKVVGLKKKKRPVAQKSTSFKPNNILKPKTYYRY